MTEDPSLAEIESARLAGALGRAAAIGSITAAGPAWLFCPGDRPDRFEKAAAAADVVILDLEDAVAPDRKVAARAAVSTSRLDPSRTVVRVNAAGDRGQTADLEAAFAAGYHVVMLPKAESAEQITAVDEFGVIALVETPRGVLAATELAAAPATIGMMWGAEDLVAGVGGRSSRHANGSYREVARYARSTVLVAAAAHGRFALDAVHLAIPDLEGLGAEVLDAAASGFAGTACIHPSQVPVVRAGYRPDDAEIDWATRVLEAAQSQPGVFSLEGRMIDGPLLRQAETTLARAGVDQ